MTAEKPRYATLQDYLRVIRRRRLLIVLIVIGSIALALGSALSQETEYTATSQLSFRDPGADAGVLTPGGDVIPEQSPAQRSAINAELVNRPEVVRGVSKRLDTDVSEDDLADAVTGEVGVQTNLVQISAVWADAEFAAELANAFAIETRELGIRDARKQLDRAAAILGAEVNEAKQATPEEPFRVSALETALSRLEALRDISNPVVIAERAEVPDSPSSPQVARDAILGGVLGLILALVIAFIRDSLDRRVHNAQEIHEETALPVLGRINEIAFSYAGLSLNGSGRMSETEFEAFRMLRMNLAFLREGSPPRSVLVTSAVPEEGKSTVSMALASAAALAGQRVLLIECDLRRPSFTRRLGLSREPGLTDYLRGTARPGDILQVVEIGPPARFDPSAKKSVVSDNGKAPSMVCIAAGGGVQNAPELLQSEQFRDLMGKVSKAYDLVVLDGSPLLSVADPLEIVPTVDGVLVCVRVQRTTRDQVRAVRAALGHLPDRPTGVVVTGLRRGDESYEYYYGY